MASLCAPFCLHLFSLDTSLDFRLAKKAGAHLTSLWCLCSASLYLSPRALRSSRAAVPLQHRLQLPRQLLRLRL